MYNNSMKTLEALLEAGIKASKHSLQVFPCEEDELHGALYVADQQESDFRVVIVPEERMHTVKTIAGDREMPTTFFNIHVPQYDEGDSSVGMDGYYYVDTDEPFTWSFQSVVDVAVKVLSWINEYEINMAVNNAAEYLYYQEQEAIAEQFEQV